MGNCGEETARKLGIDREAQDEYALGSYRRWVRVTDRIFWLRLLSTSILFSVSIVK